jgi:hypothetical protein
MRGRLPGVFLGPRCRKGQDVPTVHTSTVPGTVPYGTGTISSFVLGFCFTLITIITRLIVDVKQPACHFSILS